MQKLVIKLAYSLNSLLIKITPLFLIFFIISAHAEDITLCRKAWSKSTSGEYKQSLNFFAKCIEKGKLSNTSLAQTYRNIGITLKKDGQYIKAIENYNKALPLNPSDPWDDYVNRGNAWSELGNFAKAFADYDKALEVKPNYNQVYYNRGIVFEKQGDYENAIMEFKRAYKLGLRSKLLIERFVAHKITFQESSDNSTIKTKDLQSFPEPPNGYVWVTHRGVAIPKPSAWFEHRAQGTYATSVESIKEHGIFETGATIQVIRDVQKRYGSPALVAAISVIEKIRNQKANKILLFDKQEVQGYKTFTIRYKNTLLAAKPIIVHKFIMSNDKDSYVNIITFESSEEKWNKYWKKEGITIFKRILSVTYYEN